MHILTNLSDYLPAQLELGSALKFILFFATAVLAVGLVARAFLGQRSSLNHAISTAMGILSIYALTMAVYTFNPYELSRFLAPLPFVTFRSDTLVLFSFQDAQLAAICTQVLSMLILTFLVNLLDGFVPKGSNLIGWYLFRFVTVLLSMGLHYVVTWAFNTFLPGALAAYAPTILMVALVALLGMGLLNLLLGLVLTVVNPIFGAIYAFFFSNRVGKGVSKALLTTLILCAVVFALDHFGYGLISISPSALQAYIPFLGAMLVLWYVIGNIL